jgi:hypothetical protein
MSKFAQKLHSHKKVNFLRTPSIDIIYYNSLHSYFDLAVTLGLEVSGPSPLDLVLKKM